MSFFSWLFSEEITYTKKEIDALIEEIKVFNAGAIDKYLSEHVDKVYHNWLRRNSDEG